MAEGALLPPVIVRLLGDMTQLRGTLREARTQVDGTARGFQAAGATAFAGMAKMGRSVSLVGVGVAVAATKMAGDFQAETAVLQTAAGESARGLATVRKGILSISEGTGTGIKNLVDGMYQIEKAGYRGSDGLTVLKAAAQGAKEENAQLSTVTNAMTSVMASYHLKASDSVRVMNGLKTAAGEGKMTMEEFAGSLSTVLPIASANKISLEQVSGALATLTQHGTSAREGTQELANTIRNLAKPNGVAITEMQRFGLSSTDVSTKLGSRGLTGTLNLLSQTVLSKMGKSGTVLLSAFNNSKQAAANLKTMLDSMPSDVKKLASGLEDGSMSVKEYGKAIKGLPADQYAMGQQFATLYEKSHGFNAALKSGGPAAETYTAAIAKMTGGATGLNTTLMLTGENTTGFNERVKKIGESFNHASGNVEGWDVTQKLFNVQIAKAKATIEVLAIEIGTKLIPVVTSVVGWFGKHKDIAVALAAVIGGVLVLSVVAYAATLVMSAASAVISFGKMGVSAVQAGGRVVQGFRDAQVAGSAFSGAAGSFGGLLRKGFDGAVSGAKAAGTAIAEYASALGRAFAIGGKMAWASMVSGLKAVGVALRTASLAALEFSKSMITSAVTAVRTAAAWVAEKVALVATAVAEKAAAAAQWLLNVAMDANPIMIVVLALAALVAGLILVYNKFAWFRDLVQGALKAVGAAVGWLVGFVKANWPTIIAVLTAGIAPAVMFIVQHWNKISSGFASAYHATLNWGRSLIAWVAALPGRIGGFLAGLPGQLSRLASSAWHSFLSASVSAGATVIAWIRALPGRIKSGLGSLGSLLWSAGKDLVMGLVHGIESMAGTAVSMVKNVGHDIASGFKSVLGISSPSKVFRQLGIYVNEGLIDGLTGSTARVKTATNRIASLLTQTFNKVADLKGTKGVSNKWVASHEAAIRHLEAYAAKEDRIMRSLAAKRDSVAARIKTAQKAVAAAQKQWNAEVKTVAQGVMQGFSIITAAPQQGFALTAQDVVNKMRDQMAKATQFAADLQAAQRKGLRSDLVAQIAAAGVDQGGETAAALAGATKGQIAAMNQLQTATQGAANGVGVAVADSMYGAGLKSAQGLVKGLQSQEKAIEKQMMRIAQSMQKAIKRALGIKSPSTVFAEIGTWIPKGLAKGVDGSAHHATGAVHRLAGSVVGAGSTVGAGLAMGGGGGGPTVVHNHFEFNIEGNAVTMERLAKDVEQAFLRRGMRNPATYPSYKR